MRELAEIKYEQQELHKQIEVYQRALTQRDALLPRLYTDEKSFSFPAKNICIDAMYPLHRNDGFYDLEFDSQNRPYRWTGPSTSFQFSIFIPNTQQYSAELTLFGSLNKDNLKNIQVYVNGNRQDAHFDVSPVYKFKFSVPERDNVGSVSIVFMISSTEVPNSLKSDAEDHRELGVAFHSLELTAVK